MNQDNDSQLWLAIEQDIASIIISRLEDRKISIERASAIAKFVIESIPIGITDRQLIEIIPKLDDDFSELTLVVDKFLSEYMESDRHEKLNDVRKQLGQYISNKSNGTV
jgi:hypothetical protein